VAPYSIDPRTHKVVKADIRSRSFHGCKHNSQVEAYECDAPITSGSDFYSPPKLFPPRADLFIDGVDLDYGMRLGQKAFII